MLTEKSECNGSWLHRYRIVKQYDNGIVERCDICQDEQFFHKKIPNYEYLAFHQRQALQKDNPRFIKEYPNN